MATARATRIAALKQAVDLEVSRHESWSRDLSDRYTSRHMSSV
jgi:hypothetical protein